MSQMMGELSKMLNMYKRYPYTHTSYDEIIVP